MLGLRILLRSSYGFSITTGSGPSNCSGSSTSTRCDAKPGGSSDFGAATIAVSVLMIVLTFSAVGTRFYSTVRVSRSTGLEDCERVLL